MDVDDHDRYGSLHQSEGRERSILFLKIIIDKSAETSEHKIPE